MSDPHADTPDAAERAGISERPEALDDDVYEEYLGAYEERLAQQRLSSIEAGRRKGGLAGAAMAGAMLAVNEIVEGPKKDDKPVTVEASSDPDDIDRDGIALEVGEVGVEAPALERIDPIVGSTDGRKRPQV